MRVVLAALLTAFVLASCSTRTNPLRVPDIIAEARIVAVTIPESLVAGSPVEAILHWYPRDCGERILRIDKTEASPGQWTLRPITARPGYDYGCPASAEGCGSKPTFVVLTVPPSGVDHYAIVGTGDTLRFDLGAGISETDPGHRVTFLDRANGQPIAGLSYHYLSWGSGKTLGKGTTDSTGTARVAPPPCPEGPMDWIDLIVTDSCDGSTMGWDPDAHLCGRALRSIVLYGPFGSATWIRAKAAM